MEATEKLEKLTDEINEMFDEIRKCKNKREIAKFKKAADKLLLLLNAELFFMEYDKPF